MKYEKMIQKLEHNGYKVSFFETSAAASEYILENVKGSTVGFGDSETLSSMALPKLLSENNSVVDPAQYKGEKFYEAGKMALAADVFFTSVNAATETGELVNIDSTGNRLAGSIFGHKKVYFVFGTNKIEPTLEKAVWRARNIAAPLNAKRHGYKTPCAAKADKCYDCSCPDRICNSLNIYLKKMKHTEAEIIMIDESLGL